MTLPRIRNGISDLWARIASRRGQNAAPGAGGILRPAQVQPLGSESVRSTPRGDARSSAERWVSQLRGGALFLGRRLRLTIVGLAQLCGYYPAEVSRAGQMTVRDTRFAINHQKTARPFNLNALSRRSIVILQMLGDGLFMTILSYLSLSSVTYLHISTGPIQSF